MKNEQKHCPSNDFMTILPLRFEMSGVVVFPWSAQHQTVRKSISQIWLTRIRRGLGRKQGWSLTRGIIISSSVSQATGRSIGLSQLSNKYKQAILLFIWGDLGVCMFVCVCVLRGMLLISLDSDGVIMMLLLLHCTIISAPHCDDSGSISQLGGLSCVWFLWFFLQSRTPTGPFPLSSVITRTVYVSCETLWRPVGMLQYVFLSWQFRLQNQKTHSPTHREKEGVSQSNMGFFLYHIPMSSPSVKWRWTAAHLC